VSQVYVVRSEKLRAGSERSDYRTSRALVFMRPRLGSVQIGIDSRLSVIAFCDNEEGRTHAQTNILRPLSHLWRLFRGVLCAAFRSSSLRITRRA
jgi:hypothetical protein